MQANNYKNEDEVQDFKPAENKSSASKEFLKQKLETLPIKPGSYQMKDRNGTIIYVGKAKNLKNRVNSYFKGSHDYKTTKLVSEIVDFDYIVTASEKEALILEYNLIKEYDPKYNIIFKDDASYPYILLEEGEIPYCRYMRISKKTRYHGEIFGPFPDASAATRTSALINKIFPTRKCKTLGKEVCLYYHMGQCLGYCKYDVNKDEMATMKAKIRRFLKGDNTELVGELKKAMLDFSERQEYERAAEYRDLISDINYVTADRQTVQVNRKDSFDTFAYAVEDNYLAIVSLFIRDGRLISKDLHIDHLYGDADEEFVSYLYQFYQKNLAPKVLILAKEVDSAALEDLNVVSVTKGFAYQMLKKAHENASVELKQRLSIIKKDDQYYDDIAKSLIDIIGFVPKRIEVFDNSHLGGKATVAGMVVYENLKPNKKEYRHYKLEDSFDDLKSMHEVLYRRYFRVLKDDLKRPDLIIIDGAYNQLKVAIEVLDSLGMDIKVLTLGKDEHHNTAYLLDSNGVMIDIDVKSPIFLFLASMQDEVHHFAISYNRRLRQKNAYVSKLDGVKGLGKKRRLKLLRKHKSIRNIEALSLVELEEDLPKDVAVALYQHLHEEVWAC